MVASPSPHPPLRTVLFQTRTASVRCGAIEATPARSPLSVGLPLLTIPRRQSPNVPKWNAMWVLRERGVRGVRRRGRVFRSRRFSAPARSLHDFPGRGKVDFSRGMPSGHGEKLKFHPHPSRRLQPANGSVPYGIGPCLASVDASFPSQRRSHPLAMGWGECDAFCVRGANFLTFSETSLKIVTIHGSRTGVCHQSVTFIYACTLLLHYNKCITYRKIRKTSKFWDLALNPDFHPLPRVRGAQTYLLPPYLNKSEPSPVVMAFRDLC